MNSSSSFSTPSSCNVHGSPSSDSSRIAGPSCIFRILRRILCFTSLPSCPFDHFKVEEKEITLPTPSGGSGPPGVVARLMGLESLPQIEHNSADSIKKSSRSSPQVIPLTYRELEDENFFILSFDEHYCKRKKKSTRSRRERTMQEMDKENQGAINGMVIAHKDLVSDVKNHEAEFQVENLGNVLRPVKNSCQKHGKRRKKTTKEEGLVEIRIETEGGSENSSPNSVLEFVELPDDRESTSSGDDSRLANCKLRRTLSEELENCGKSKEKKLIINNGFSKVEEKELSRLMSNRHQLDYAEKWDDEIRKLAAFEMFKSSWIHDQVSRNQHYVKEIGTDLASEILHQLLEELID